MENLSVGWIGLGVVFALAIVTFIVYQWRQTARVNRVNDWVNGYLRTRYGQLPGRLSVHCSHDATWPVLVRFDTPGTQDRRALQFACHGQQSKWTLLAEKIEQRDSD